MYVIERRRREGRDQSCNNMELEGFQVAPNAVPRPETSSNTNRGLNIQFQPQPIDDALLEATDIEMGYPGYLIVEKYPETYFSYHFTIIRVLGMCPISSSNQRTSLLKWGHVFAINLIALVQGLGWIKYFLTAKTTSMKYCIDLGYHIIRACIRIAFFAIIIFRRKQLAELMKMLKKFPRIFGVCFNSRMVKVSTIGIAVTSVIKNAAQQVQYGESMASWDLKETLLLRSFELARTYLYWNKEIKNGTDHTFGQIYTLYGMEVNPLTIFCATIQLLLEVIGSSYECLAQDIMLTAALTLFILTNSFEGDLFFAKFDGRVAVIPKMTPDMWKKFTFLKAFSQELNGLFDWLFNCLHANNFMIGSYFLFEVTHGSYSDGELIYFLYDIVKVFITYKLLAKSSAANGKFNRWIQETYAQCNKFDIDENTHVFVPNLLFELSTSPIGLQSSSFNVDTGFNIQFMGTVIHYFLLLVTATNDKK